MTEAKKLTLGDLDVGDVKPPEKQSGIIKIPQDENAPLVCKLVVDPRRPKDAYYPVLYHTHRVGPRSSDIRYHLCAKSYNEPCAECDKYWEKVEEMQTLKKAGRAFIEGKTDDQGRALMTEEYKAVKAQRDLYKQSSRYWMLVLPVGETRPKALLVVQEVIDNLFGRKADKDGKGAINGIFYAMKDKGRSPYNLRSSKGWIKMYRTGTAPKVKYNVSEYMIETKMQNPQDGSMVDVMVPFSNSVPDSVLEIDVESIIDIASIDANNMRMKWSTEEIAKYAESFEIPDRCKKSGTSSSEASKLPDDDGDEDMDSEAQVSAAPAKEEKTSKSSSSKSGKLDELDKMF